MNRFEDYVQLKISTFGDRLNVDVYSANSIPCELTSNKDRKNSQSDDNAI